MPLSVTIYSGCAWFKSYSAPLRACSSRLPVAARNQVVGGEFHLTTAQFGPNFYIGNNESARGTYQPLRFGHGTPEYERRDATELAEQALGRHLSPAEVSRFWTRKAMAYI